MKTKEYLVKETTVVEMSNGRFGKFAKYLGLNFSIRKMKGMGFEIKSLSKEEVDTLKNMKKEQEADDLLAYYNQKLKDRFEQVEICLKSEPILISQKAGEICPTANLGNTKMIDAYNGCGKGTAYIKDGCVVAFHYGYEKPENAPNLESQAVMLSCTQICF